VNADDSTSTSLYENREQKRNQYVNSGAWSRNYVSLITQAPDEPSSSFFSSSCTGFLPSQIFSRAADRSAPLIESGAVTGGQDLDIASIELEDQDGRRFEWHQFFRGKPSVLAFFYATCMNPRKCAQTIYNLANIHKGLLDAGLDGQVRVAAITYDPQRDTPAVLRQYGESKGISFGTNCKMMRAPRQFDGLVDAFDLGVNYIGNQVNDHRVELYLLDCDGKITHAFLRLQANPEHVITELARLASESRASTSGQ